MPDDWRDLVTPPGKRKNERINRIAYEMCVLNALREKLRCKEIWVQGANLYCNPDDDLPADFTARRTDYYAELKAPLEVEEFLTNASRRSPTRFPPSTATCPITPK